jgi:hypothetical protein
MVTTVQTGLPATQAEAKTLAMGALQPDMIVTPQKGATRLKPLTTKAMASEVGQTGGDTVEASPVVAAGTGLHSCRRPPLPSKI